MARFLLPFQIWSSSTSGDIQQHFQKIPIFVPSSSNSNSYLGKQSSRHSWLLFSASLFFPNVGGPAGKSVILTPVLSPQLNTSRVTCTHMLFTYSHLNVKQPFILLLTFSIIVSNQQQNYWESKVNTGGKKKSRFQER